MSSIAVLITCHNRKVKTLLCLQSLFSQKGIGDFYDIEVFLVDDGCTDGTPEAIRQNFPQVTIIKGNGELYWNSGMHLAWKMAAKTQDFDYYLWLNDDTYLYDSAIKSLLLIKYPNDIVSGTTQSQINLNATYGGYTSKPHQLILPNGYYQLCDYSNGNCVLIPKNVFKKTGNLDPVFTHAFGDFDYSLRAQLFGFKVYVSPEFIGICEAHDFIYPWQSSSNNLACRLRNLYSKSSGCNPFELYIFEKRHFGFFLAIIRVISTYFRVFFPNFFYENNWPKTLIKFK